MAFTAHIKSIRINMSIVVTRNELVASRTPPLATAAKTNVPIIIAGLVAVSRIKPKKNNVGNMKPDHVKVSS